MMVIVISNDNDNERARVHGDGESPRHDYWPRVTGAKLRDNNDGHQYQYSEPAGWPMNP